MIKKTALEMFHDLVEFLTKRKTVSFNPAMIAI